VQAPSTQVDTVDGDGDVAVQRCGAVGPDRVDPLSNVFFFNKSTDAKGTLMTRTATDQWSVAIGLAEFSFSAVQLLD
jgi:hypothetical protein